MENNTAASVIVPTKNRAALVQQFLPSLAEQDVAEPYEIIIVDNGSRDSTAAVVNEAAARWPHIRMISERIPGSGPALHAGALAANSPIMIFVDDDMRAVPDLVAHHLKAHRINPGSCILGHIISAPTRHPFDRMQAYIFDGPRSTLSNRQPEPSDYWSGNVSLARELYFSLGGYNLKFAEIGYGGMDVDFGNRLAAAGVPFLFVPQALTYHHFTERFVDRLGKARRVGVACAYLKEKHPEFQVDEGLLVKGKWYTGAIVAFCRLTAGLIEPFAYGEGTPFTPLAFVYDLGLRSATQVGVLDYERKAGRVSPANETRLR